MHRLAIVLAIALVMILNILIACKVTRVTQPQVEERIAKELPLGSSVPEVIGFLNRLEINGLKARQPIGYVPGEPLGTERLEGKEDQVGGSLYAVIENSARDDTKLQVYSISMRFYFDRNERLIAYKLRTQGDW